VRKNITSELDDDPVNYGGDTIALDNRAAEQKAQIDTKVFELYNITQSEIRTIFEHLNTHTHQFGKRFEVI
jgi:hypothetical protein